MTNNKPKKKWYQKWWIWAIIVVAVLSATSNKNKDDAPVEDNDVSISDMLNSDINETKTDTSEGMVDEQHLSFELVAGEPGEYGELFTINKDTEFEETYYIYHIPAGTYTVTNIGEYRTQFNVCCDGIVVNEDGWEEPSGIPYVKAFDVGETDTFTIEDGQYIEIHEPTKLAFEQNK